MKNLFSSVWTVLAPSSLRLVLRGAAVAFTAALAAASAMAADRVVVQIDWLPSGDKGPFYVALHEGFYASEGLEVTLQTGRGSADALTKVATGAADIASSGISAVLSAAAKGPMPLKVVYTAYTESPESFFVIKGSGIRTLKDLQGRPVAATALSTSRVLMPLVLERNGVSVDQLKLQLVDANVLMPMLVSGRVDAISSFRTQVPLANSLLQPRGKEVEVLPWSMFGLETYGMVLRGLGCHDQGASGCAEALLAGVSQGDASFAEGSGRDGAGLEEIGPGNRPAGRRSAVPRLDSLD